MTTPKPFEWVRERAECSIDKVFEKLRLEVKNDVELRQETRERSQEFGFLNAFHFTSSIILVQINSAVLSAAGKKKAESL
jgi:hypothetical protein